MRGTRGVRPVQLVCAVVVLLFVGSQAKAFEFWDGRLQIHGYYEMTLRAIQEDFHPANDLDMTQWYHTLNLEIEADIAPDGWGPFDLVSAFARVEARYDCVWRHGCWMFPSVNMYGNGNDGRQAQRVTGGHRSGFSGNAFTGDVRQYNRVHDHDSLNSNDGRAGPRPGVGGPRPGDSRKVIGFPFIAGFEGFTSATARQDANTRLDPATNVWKQLGLFGKDKCYFNHQKTKGSANGNGVRVLGPWDPKCKIEGPDQARILPNPFKGTDGGGLSLPYRPAPNYRHFGPNGLVGGGRSLAGIDFKAPNSEAQGLFIPNHKLARRLSSGGFDSFDQNFNQDQLAWNHGASQKYWRELKELYVDLEMFDSRLWVRLGKQNIVWGKTELFRTTDQFNPQDLGLASLPSLEESRIALWAARAVWSFYEVGPLEDFRFEIALNFDKFEPTDLGRCGEPYSPLPVCDKSFGLTANNVVGLGLAGEVRPPKPWDDISGIEIGARIEFRYDRFSVAISDWYGYGDGGIAERLFNYSRNVDPLSGRPRKGSELDNQRRCKNGAGEACLGVSESLSHASVNQQLFGVICATTVGFSDLDPTACALNVFNSKNIASGFPIANALALVMGGQNGFGNAFSGAAIHAALGGFNARTYAALARFPNVQRFLGGFVAAIPDGCAGTAFLGSCPTPLVPLSRDPQDGPFTPLTGLLAPFGPSQLSAYLTDEQEALLGCGPFYRTNCDNDGIDLMNAEASAILQAFPLIDSTETFNYQKNGNPWDTTNRRLAQPGTRGFGGATPCTRFERGRAFILPGCRGPGDPGYSINKDGSLTGPDVTSFTVPGGIPGSPRVHPFTGQNFRSEMAIFSWNFLMLLVTNSTASDGTGFDPNNAMGANRCSFRNPGLCSAVSSFLAVTGVGRPDVRAGGSGSFGRRDFIWAGGAQLYLRYEKRNVFGVSVDFAEDVSKSNWSFEFTYIEGQPFSTVDEADGLRDVDTFNLTVSADRPTFINFLNANRTFFFNTQWFFQYINSYTKGHTSNGPWNVFFTFAVNTGYFQDRLLPSLVFVYDFGSNSGAILPQVTYRFNEAFSASVGLGIFGGRQEQRSLAWRPSSIGNSIGGTRNSTFVENGLSAIRERDEIFLRIRYTF